jgi:hypothetical protein
LHDLLLAIGRDFAPYEVSAGLPAPSPDGRAACVALWSWRDVSGTAWDFYVGKADDGSHTGTSIRNRFDGKAVPLREAMESEVAAELDRLRVADDPVPQTPSIKSWRARQFDRLFGPAE